MLLIVKIVNETKKQKFKKRGEKIYSPFKGLSYMSIELFK